MLDKMRKKSNNESNTRENNEIDAQQTHLNSSNSNNSAEYIQNNGNSENVSSNIIEGKYQEQESQPMDLFSNESKLEDIDNMNLPTSGFTNFQSNNHNRINHEDLNLSKSIQTLLGDEPDYSKVQMIEEENKKWKLKSNPSIKDVPLFSNLNLDNFINNDRINETSRNGDNPVFSNNIMYDCMSESQETIENNKSEEIKFPKRFKSLKYHSMKNILD
jgi:hypothetical protein